MTTLYYRQIREDGAEPELINKLKAIYSLRNGYKNPEEVLDSTSCEHPAQTCWAHYWKEESDQEGLK